MKIDGVDVRDVATKDLRSQIALVSREPLLFSGTIADNIAIGKPSSAQQEIEAAARHACAHDFIR